MKKNYDLLLGLSTVAWVDDKMQRLGRAPPGFEVGSMATNEYTPFVLHEKFTPKFEKRMSRRTHYIVR